MHSEISIMYIGSLSQRLYMFLMPAFWFMVAGSNNHNTVPGYSRQLGSVGPTVLMDTVPGYPTLKTFFHSNVYQSKPIKMKGAVQHSYARLHWTDDYFLSQFMQQEPVLVYGEKKQTRNPQLTEMHFNSFIQKYHKTEICININLPEFLRKDVVLPTMLHCEDLTRDKIIDVNLQMSSGVTKSLLHKESAEKIICVYDGVKQFILIDPQKYYEKVDLDLPIAEASELDVDSVDYGKYPGLAEVEFIVTNISAGDCIYIPFKWFHQMNSYFRSVATAVRWENQQVLAADISQCSGQYDPTVTADNIEFIHSKNKMNTVNLRDFFKGITKKRPISLEMFKTILLNETELWNETDQPYYNKLIREIIGIIDKNGDLVISEAEVMKVSKKEWVYIKDIEIALDDMVVIISEDTRNLTTDETSSVKAEL